MLHAIWKDDPVEYSGRFFRVPKSIIQPKPAQQPHPPVFLAAYSPPAVRRIARYADGWIPVGAPVDGMRQMLAGIRQQAQEFGRTPDDIHLIVRANVDLREQPLGVGRWLFTGSKDEVRADLAAVRELGADEVHFDPSFMPDTRDGAGFLAKIEQLRELAA